MNTTTPFTDEQVRAFQARAEQLIPTAETRVERLTVTANEAKERARQATNALADFDEQFDLEALAARREALVEAELNAEDARDTAVTQADGAQDELDELRGARHDRERAARHLRVCAEMKFPPVSAELEAVA